MSKMSVVSEVLLHGIWYIRMRIASGILLHGIGCMSVALTPG